MLRFVLSLCQFLLLWALCIFPSRSPGDHCLNTFLRFGFCLRNPSPYACILFRLFLQAIMEILPRADTTSAFWLVRVCQRAAKDSEPKVLVVLVDRIYTFRHSLRICRHVSCTVFLSLFEKHLFSPSFLGILLPTLFFRFGARWPSLSRRSRFACRLSWPKACCHHQLLQLRVVVVVVVVVVVALLPRLLSLLMLPLPPPPQRPPQRPPQKWRLKCTCCGAKWCHWCRQ